MASACRSACAAMVGLAGLAGLALGPSARAGEAAFCITCKGPDQTYVCRVTGESARQSDALKLYCIIRTAKEGNHASCAATGKVEGCNGVAKVYAYDGPAIPDAIMQNPQVQKFMSRVERDQDAPPAPKSSEPKTLVEMTGRAVDASRDRWRDTFGGTPQNRTESTAPASIHAEAEPLTPLPPPPSARAVETASLPPSPPPQSKSRVRRAAQSAGSAVGSAARTTYRCLRSFFFNCRGTAPN